MPDSSSKLARLLVHDPDSGEMNMAIDQAILESTAASGKTTLRFYRWTPATLSLGYFQKLGDRANHAASENCSVIRRASGGGAIVHDDELTYSICIASKGSIAKANSNLYDTVHHAIRIALAEQGIEVELYETEEGSQIKASKSDPFLCFERRAIGDIICDGAKVGGSAQRRLKNALIQHGSVLLSQSSFAPELPGLKEQSGIEVNCEALLERVTELLQSKLGYEFESGELTSEEISRARTIADEKFGSTEWIEKR